MRLTALFLVSVALRAQSSIEASPDARAIIRKSVDHDLFNYERLKNYTYTEDDDQRFFDKRGNLKKTERETYEVLFLGGGDNERVLARDGKHLPEK
jgi:hypothetical protein